MKKCVGLFALGLALQGFAALADHPSCQVVRQPEVLPNPGPASHYFLPLSKMAEVTMVNPSQYGEDRQFFKYAKEKGWILDIVVATNPAFRTWKTWAEQNGTPIVVVARGRSAAEPAWICEFRTLQRQLVLPENLPASSFVDAQEYPHLLDGKLLGGVVAKAWMDSKALFIDPNFPIEGLRGEPMQLYSPLNEALNRERDYLLVEPKDILMEPLDVACTVGCLPSWDQPSFKFRRGDAHLVSFAEAINSPVAVKEGISSGRIVTEYEVDAVMAARISKLRSEALKKHNMLIALPLNVLEKGRLVVQGSPFGILVEKHQVGSIEELRSASVLTRNGKFTVDWAALTRTLD